MAPNGTSRKTPAKPGKGEEGVASLAHLFDDLQDDKPELKDDVKKALPHVKNPGKWDSEVVYDNDSKSSSPVPVERTKVTPTIAKAFPTGKPMQDKPDILKCNHCKRAVSRHAMPKHIEACLNKKQEKQRKKKEAKDARDAAARKTAAGDSEEEEEEEASKTATKTGGSMGASKKRKAEDNADDAPAKKKKKGGDSKAKPARPKMPVDVEKQCGVALPNGGQCARSLTCKSHSMGAKRAVAGRSAPYDKLLADYQRKNQAKIQKAQFDAAALEMAEDEGGANHGPVDEDEERDSIMNSITQNWGGQPLYQPVMVPLSSRYQYNRIKGMLLHGNPFGNSNRGGGIFGGSGGGGFFGGTLPTLDEQNVVHARRGSVVPGARSMMAPAASSSQTGGVRRPSIAT